MTKLITESRTKPSGVLYAVINTSTLDALPVLGTDNGNGTSTLKVDTELTATIDPTGLATEAKQPTLEGTDKAKVSLYVKKSANADTVLTLGKTDDANSIPVALSTESLAALETITFTIPAGNLGQQHKTASLSVAPADDITDATYIGDIKFGESLPAGTALLGKVSIDQVTANANEVVIKSITAGPLPDTSASDFSHIHSNSDSIKTAVEILDNCISGSEAQVDVVSLPISFNAGANDTTTQRVVLSTETLAALENITASIDQTTDGTTNRVVAKISQTAGENHVEICDSSGNGITSTANALDINIKSGNPATIGISGSLPDTAATDLAHIHAKVDNLNVGDQVKALSISVAPATDITDGRYIGDIKFGEAAPLDVSYSTGATDSKTIRVKLSNEDLSALENVTIDSSALPTGASTSANQTTGNNSLSSIDGKLSASTINEYNVVLTAVDTEYSQALPDNCKGIEFVSRGGYLIRYAFTTGKVAGLTSPYFTLRSNCSYENPITLNLSSKTIYFASDNAGDVVELIAWS